MRFQILKKTLFRMYEISAFLLYYPLIFMLTFVGKKKKKAHKCPNSSLVIMQMRASDLSQITNTDTGRK